MQWDEGGGASLLTNGRTVIAIFRKTDKFSVKSDIVLSGHLVACGTMTLGFLVCCKMVQKPDDCLDWISIVHKCTPYLSWRRLSEAAPTKALFAAPRIAGTFALLDVRHVPWQAKTRHNFCDLCNNKAALNWKLVAGQRSKGSQSDRWLAENSSWQSLFQTKWKSCWLQVSKFVLCLLFCHFDWKGGCCPFFEVG